MFKEGEELKCAIKAMNGDKGATNELVRRNLRFVISVAKQYQTANTTLEDLVNEGNIGLIMAAEKYKGGKGFRFITYAVFWIRKMILEYLAKNGRIVRLPSNKINGLSKLNQCISKLEQQLGRTVDISEVVAFSTSMSKTEVTELEAISTVRCESLDSIVGNGDGGTSLYEMVADNTFQPTDHLVTDADTKTQVAIILKSLKPRDREIIVSLYGLDGSTPMSLKNVAEQVGLTREMVRQIKQKSLDTLKMLHLATF
jgi:RNA polymerase primary sigma factor